MLTALKMLSALKALRRNTISLSLNLRFTCKEPQPAKFSKRDIRRKYLDHMCTFICIKFDMNVIRKFMGMTS